MVLWNQFVTIIILYNSFAIAQIEYHGPASEDYFRDLVNISFPTTQSIECGTSVHAFTKNNDFVNYYKIQITTAMKEMYQDIHVTTCCDMAIDGLYCNATSLDSNIYILYEKKDQINLLATSDDVSSAICNNTVKSFIALINYKVGEYIIGIGGYNEEYGPYFLEMKCVPFDNGYEECNMSTFSLIYTILITIFYFMCAFGITLYVTYTLYREKVQNYDSTKGFADINKILERCIESFDDNVDVYQILAIRHTYNYNKNNETNSDDEKNEMDFKSDANETEVFNIYEKCSSPYSRMLLVAVIIFVTQILSVLLPFGQVFFVDQDETKCYCSSDRWQAVALYKILAMVLQMTISISVYFQLKKTYSSALYPLLKLKKMRHMKEVNKHIKFSYLIWGLFTNATICSLCSTLSNKLIFDARLDDSYAQAGISMIMNALAVFFIVELDNLFITQNEKDICKKRLQQLIDDQKFNLELEASSNGNGVVFLFRVWIVRVMVLYTVFSLNAVPIGALYAALNVLICW